MIAGAGAICASIACHLAQRGARDVVLSDLAGRLADPAVGEAAAAELSGEDPPLDLSPYRLERFGEDAVFPETLVL